MFFIGFLQNTKLSVNRHRAWGRTAYLSWELRLQPFFRYTGHIWWVDLVLSQKWNKKWKVLIFICITCMLFAYWDHLNIAVTKLLELKYHQCLVITYQEVWLDDSCEVWSLGNYRKDITVFSGRIRCTILCWAPIRIVKKRGEEEIAQITTLLFCFHFPLQHMV